MAQRRDPISSNCHVFFSHFRLATNKLEDDYSVAKATKRIRVAKATKRIRIAMATRRIRVAKATRRIRVATLFLNYKTKQNKSVRTTMRLKWAFWDILGHSGTF